MKKEKNPELKPCPFCGSTFVSIETLDNEGEYFRAECSLGHALDWWNDTLEDAVQMWNTRADKWRSIKDDPPEFDEMGESAKILIYDSLYGKIILDRLIKFDHFYGLWRGNYTSENGLTHWQLLPDQPEKK